MKKVTLLVLFVLPLIGFSQNYNVTFRVDMNQYNITAIGQVEILGSFNNWAGDVNILDDSDADGVYEATIAMPAGAIEYLFFVDSNSTNQYQKEDFNSTQPFCTTGNPPFVNRAFTVSGDTTLGVVCWESCVDCASAPQNADITFVVDMNNYQGSYTDVHLNGSFNNWCGNCAPMEDLDGDKIFELTVTIPDGDTSEYKFTVDNFADQEIFAGGEPCTKTTVDAGGQVFINRFIVPSGNATLPAVCWGYCVDCASIGVEENWISGLSVQPNPSSGIFKISGELKSASTITVVVYDIQGRKVMQNVIDGQSFIDQDVDLSALSDGVYLLTLDNGESTIQERIMVARQ